MCGGRSGFCAPLLGLHKFSCFQPRTAVRRIPDCVSFIIKYLSAEVSRCRHYPCGDIPRHVTVARKVDAQASGGRTGVGGCPSSNNTSDHMVSKNTCKTRCAEAFFFFFLDNSPSRMYRESMEFLHGQIREATAPLLIKLVTTDFFPESAVIMEFAAFSKKMGNARRCRLVSQSRLSRDVGACKVGLPNRLDVQPRTLSCQEHQIHQA